MSACTCAAGLLGPGCGGLPWRRREGGGAGGSGSPAGSGGGEPAPAAAASAEAAAEGSVAHPLEAFEEWAAKVHRKEAEEAHRRARRAKWHADGRWPVAETGGCVGLTNIRNTCWMNAVVQSLAHVEPIALFFLTAGELQMVEEARNQANGGDAGHPASSSSSLPLASTSGLVRQHSHPTAMPFECGVSAPRQRGEAVIAQGLQDLLRDLWQNQQRQAVVPERFHMCLTQNAPWVMKKAFRAPQDAQEFLLFIINALHEELDGNGSTDGHVHAAFENGHDHRGPNGQEASSSSRPGRGPIASCFQGMLQSSVACTVCGYTSQRHENFFHLSVPVLDTDPRDNYGAVTLQEVLAAEFAYEERLDGTNRWKCEGCGNLVVATKRESLHRLPPVVVLHLKRFAYTPAGQIRKVRTQVSLQDSAPGGLEGVDLGQFTSGSGEPAMYDIVSIVNHHGRDAFCGHYTAHCRHCVDGQWYVFNDDSVERIDGADAWLPEEVYILCLVRRSQRAA